MNGEVQQQVIDRINKSNRILIALPASPNGDALGSGLAVFDFLKKLDKEPEIVCAAADLGAFNFLPKIEQIKKLLEVSQSFVISVKTGRAKLEELSYESKDDRVDIFLKPKGIGRFTESDVGFARARFPYDLIIVLDSPSLEHLGKIYENNTDLFFETTVVNVDHHPSNEHYGEINLVDLTATSTAEIITSMIEDFEAGLIDEAIATNLLTGIIVETNSFQHVKTTPRAFLKASNLVSMGAKQQDIIRQLYKTKQISLLKLWGRALARLKQLPQYGLFYSLLSYADMKKAESDGRDVLAVMKEMVASLSDARIILLLAESQEGEVTGYFRLHPSIKSQVVASVLGGQMLSGSLGVFQVKNKAVLEVEKEVLEKLATIHDQIAV